MKQKHLFTIPLLEPGTPASYALFTIIVVSTIFLSWSVTKPYDDRGKATERDTSLSLPKAHTQLEAPFVRLAVGKNQYIRGGKIPVLVIANTRGLPSSEVFIDIRYDTAAFAPDTDQILLEKHYPVLSIVRNTPGELALSLFVPRSGEFISSVLPRDTLVGTVPFLALDATDSQMTLSNEGENKTALFGVGTDGKAPADLLRSMEGVRIRVSR